MVNILLISVNIHVIMNEIFNNCFDLNHNCIGLKNTYLNIFFVLNHHFLDDLNLEIIIYLLIYLNTTFTSRY